ncbi:HD domain-containing phosphohydrolase [uncultured Alteromonas sp.]|uniref:HD-GYP domain-containing protein n=1 Tax=uncultured Alteromonas sp. TaxID=179113 RepID=UPI0025D92983|nr:HD domain-containing phosphohydrolase [uncultured Alteromonas sp.]
MLQRIAIDELTPGMYVNRVVDDTGKVKIRSKGVVRSDAVITQLKNKGVEVVEIDTEKGVPPTAPPAPASDTAPPVAETPPVSNTDVEASNEPLTSDSLKAAEQLFQKAMAIQQTFLTQLRSGKGADVNKLSTLTQDILECVFENQAAMICLSMVQRGNDSLLEHSLNCSIHMAILADAAGFDKQSVEYASLAGLLMDTGMVKLPPELCVPEEQLSGTDLMMYQTHVDESLEAIEHSDDLPEVVKDIVSQHHERIDGSGYPKGLTGDDIEPLAQLAAVVDEFSRLGMPAPFGCAYATSKVLKSLARNKGLEQTLVNRLIGVLGIYPIGSLVKLKSGKLGIVSRRNPSNLLQPQVMTFYSVNSGHFQEVKRIDLAKGKDEIESSIGPDEFAINLPKFFTDVFIPQASD